MIDRRTLALAARLAVTGGRPALVRLAIIAVSVSLGVALLLMSLAGVNAVNAQNSRYAWLATGAQQGGPGPASAPVTSHADPLWASIEDDNYAGRSILRVDVAGTGATSPVPPGIAALPGPGQYYLSPAMGRLLRSTPADQLAIRYAGHQIGLIGNAGLPSPDSLIVIVGHTPAQLAGRPGVAKVTAINTVIPSSCQNCAPGVGDNANSIDLILSVVAVALLFPVLIFIGAATRLSAARRELRFATMRLAGATARQIAVIATVESALASLAGTAAGFGLFFVLRPALANFSLTGEPFWVSDLSLNLADVVLVAIGVPVAAAIAARLSLRRVTISPLGVSGRTTPSPPRAWRVTVLVLGIAELCYALLGPHPSTSGGQVRLYVPGFILIVAGLVIAGPWLTLVGSRLMSRHARRPAALIAGRRLADNPQAGFRAISGLVLALFVGTVAVATLAGFSAHRGVQRSSASASHTLVVEIGAAPGSEVVASGPALTRTLRQIGQIPGVEYIARAYNSPPGMTRPVSENFFRPQLISCAALAHEAGLGRCAPGAVVAAVPPWLDSGSSRTQRWPAAPVSLARLTTLPLMQASIATNGSTATIERARSLWERAFPVGPVATTVGEINADNAEQAIQYERLADVVIVISLVIAGCSLAVTATAGLNDRKRPFSLLRLSGAPLRTLRRVVLLESAVPLLVAAAVSIGVGFLSAQLFLNSQLGYDLQPPTLGYYLTVLLGLGLGLAIIVSTFPVLARITGPETARVE